ncbi:proton-conducting transporter transmembrane domain-containing protein [Nocardioides zeae]
MNPLLVARRVLAGVMVAAVLVLLLGVVVRPPDEPTTWLRMALAAYVGVLGWVVAAYAAANLRGQPRTGRFSLLLVAAVGGLLTMVSTGSLVVSAVGWTVSGAATAALVAHRGDARARRAAGVVASRLLVGDVALWLGVGVALTGGGSFVATTGTSVLLAVAVLVRSAAFPVQRWLPETAEAPSPVSALLHAGVVNGGAMLALSHWSVLAASPAALVVLAVVGVASVGVGLAALRLRPDVKGRLAGSTTAQMGLVAVQLGLALPVAALLHVLGHGCWKARLFLRAGGAVDRARASAPRSDVPARVHPLVLVVVAAGAGLAVGALVPGLSSPPRWPRPWRSSPSPRRHVRARRCAAPDRSRSWPPWASRRRTSAGSRSSRASPTTRSTRMPRRRPPRCSPRPWPRSSWGSPRPPPGCVRTAAARSRRSSPPPCSHRAAWCGGPCGSPRWTRSRRRAVSRRGSWARSSASPRPRSVRHGPSAPSSPPTRWRRSRSSRSRTPRPRSGCCTGATRARP